MMNERRVRILKDIPSKNGPVVYVMNRDFRFSDNWALLFAQQKALEMKVPLAILVHIGKNHVEATDRHHHFFIEGLREVAEDAEVHGIPFFITIGDWHDEFQKFLSIHNVGLVVTDFSPLREIRSWWDEILRVITVPVYEVDAHNVMPCFVASPKEEFAAHTFRRKVREQYREFSGAIPKVEKHPHAWGVGVDECWPRACEPDGCAVIDWAGLRKFRAADASAPVVSWAKPGEKAAHAALARFLDQRLQGYAEKRNDPTEKAQSDLSPYIRYGHISAQHIADVVEKSKLPLADKQAFLEELIVRRELAENFCFYQKHYDSFQGIREWAKTTLKQHESDVREFIYTYDEFRRGETHDALWNAAQQELVKRGKMHGYMRMYWAKKILEWTKSPEEAIEIAVRLNDTYSLDGRDPNGYVGVLWSIGGIHDRAWFDREIFGKIRYMNYNGCARKFDVEKYISYAAAL